MQLILNTENSDIDIKEMSNTEHLPAEVKNVANGKLEQVEKTESSENVTNLDDSMKQKVEKQVAGDSYSVKILSSLEDIYEDAVDFDIKTEVSKNISGNTINLKSDADVQNFGVQNKEEDLESPKVNGLSDNVLSDVDVEKNKATTKVDRKEMITEPVKANETETVNKSAHTCNNLTIENLEIEPKEDTPLIEMMEIEPVDTKNIEREAVTDSQVLLDTMEDDKMDVCVHIGSQVTTIEDINAVHLSEGQEAISIDDVQSSLAEESCKEVTENNINDHGINNHSSQTAHANVEIQESEKLNSGTNHVVKDMSECNDSKAQLIELVKSDVIKEPDQGKNQNASSEDPNNFNMNCETTEVITNDIAQETINKVLANDISETKEAQKIKEIDAFINKCSEPTKDITTKPELPLSIDIIDSNSEVKRKEASHIKDAEDVTRDKNDENMVVQKSEQDTVSTAISIESSDIHSVVNSPKTIDVVTLKDITQIKETERISFEKNLVVDQVDNEHTSKGLEISHSTENCDKTVEVKTIIEVQETDEKQDNHKTVVTDITKVMDADLTAVEVCDVLSENDTINNKISTKTTCTQEKASAQVITQDLDRATEKTAIVNSVVVQDSDDTVTVENTIGDLKPPLSNNISEAENSTQGMSTIDKAVILSSPEPRKEEVLSGTESKLSSDKIENTDEKKYSDSNDAVMIVEETKEIKIQKNAQETTEKIDKIKTVVQTIKLSNTLDILSDDDEEPNKIVSEKKPEVKIAEDANEKQCINIEDDDDIMVIDDDSISKASVVSSVNDKIEDSNSANRVLDKDKTKSVDSTGVLDQSETKESSESKPTDIGKNESAQPEVLRSETKSSESKLKSEKLMKNLIPTDFFKTYRKHLEDMTRDDLEEFCILKIVEGIVDRSGLSDQRSKLKTMALIIDEYKKKTMMLTKQNRDLQVVLKSVQEEQKKGGDLPITPLKITRSVGMQVLMTDNSRRKPIPMSSSNSNMTSSASPSGPINVRPATAKASPATRPQKVNNNQIPVPRLVPASNAVAKSNASHFSLPKTLPAVNGVKVSPAQKAAEKRAHNRIQSVTVDLTDDEPPAKTAARNPSTPPVRVVPPQNLMAPRQQNVNSPRKVFIPIGSNQPRPGGPIMLRPVQGPRPRSNNPMVRIPQSAVRAASRIQSSGRHPPPLPDAMKQYQPPNWKALPPAPDLKLSKVENGIVISWKIEGYQEDSYEEIASYQLYAYQETSAAPSTALWKKIGDVKALPLPMACTLTQFMAGFKYYFAVRAVDIRSRLGPFSLPGSILLLNKM